MRILIVEDEKELQSTIAEGLRLDGYAVDTCDDGKTACEICFVEKYDLVILDLNLPEMDGLEVLQQIREFDSELKVLILSARNTVSDKVHGLDKGANDYLTKPFAMGELLARLRSISRRQPEFSPNMLQYGNLSLNRENFELSTCRGICRLSGKEYQIMELLMRNPGRLISTELFLEKVWGYDAESDISVVWVYLSNLRKKMASIGANVQIKATRGAGYLLEEIT